MKTLKQLREEYDNKYVSQIESSEEMVLEAKSKSLARPDIPSPSKMPSLLLFRRVSYRMFPHDQVVALYYSKMIDKYLSVPFGPDGNVNLSESTVYDSIEQFELEEGAKWEKTKGAVKGALSGAVKGAAIGNAVASTPGAVVGAAIGGVRGAYKGASVKESFRSKIEEKKRDIEENILGSIASGFMDVASGIIKKAGNVPVGQSKEASTDLKREKPTKTTKSSWKKSEDPVLASKMKSAELKQMKSVQENKIADIRNMINEGQSVMNLDINGKYITLNTTMAKRILEVYDSVNIKNKKIVEGMLNEDLESFKKLLNFSIRK